MRIKKADFLQMVGQLVEVTLFDGTCLKGVLGYAREFSASYGWRTPGYFYIGDYGFRVSHVTKLRTSQFKVEKFRN